MNSIKLENGNCLDYIKKLPDNSIDLIFTDPPYNLSSQVYIKENGKPDLKKAKDFMDKWTGLDGQFLEEFYKECLRVLKYGGHCLLFGIDRQLFMFEYYANLSGFTQKQSLYWFFISNFPKASDLSKNLDKYYFNKYLDDNNLKEKYSDLINQRAKVKAENLQLEETFDKENQAQKRLKINQIDSQNLSELDFVSETSKVIARYEKAKKEFMAELEEDLEKVNIEINQIKKDSGAEREVVGKKTGERYKYEFNSDFNDEQSKSRLGSGDAGTITTPSTPLAKKYEGIKYSVAPLKQTNETIMVFQKPYKTGSCLHDVLAMENGDDTITCGGVDIEGNRCGVSQEDIKQALAKENKKCLGQTQGQIGMVVTNTESHDISNGRFPAQTYINSGASAVIDLQSNVLTSGRPQGVRNTEGGYNGKYGSIPVTGFGDSGGASRILHKCNYELEDFDLYHYCPKVSKAERNEGLEGFELKEAPQSARSTPAEGRQSAIGEPRQNFHPTVKPKALLSKILKLFKTPNDQVLLDPFMGSGSMGISAIETGFDYIGYELDPEYFKIAEARIENAQSKLENQLFYLC